MIISTLRNFENSFGNQMKGPKTYTCAFSVCKSHIKKQPKHRMEVIYYPFPPEGDMKKLWISIVRQQRGVWDWSWSSRICAEHFRPSLAYVDKRGNRKLFKHAIPSFQAEGDDETVLNDVVPEPPRPVMTMYSKSQMIKLRKLKLENMALRDGNKKLEVQAKNLLTQNIQYARERAAMNAAAVDTGSGRKRKLE